MRHWNIMGDETNDPDQFVHCAECKKELNVSQAFLSFECSCGADLALEESIIEGRQLRERNERFECDLAEWIKLNNEHCS